MQKESCILELRDVSFCYGSSQKNQETQPVVSSVSFQLGQGELGTLLGPSGCGKTTLFHLIAGILQPSSGSIYLNQSQVSSEKSMLPPEKRNIGVVFQDYLLFPHLTVFHNIKFGLNQKKGLSKEQKNARVQELLQLIQLEGYGERYPHELSGGQQQRVALARALAPSPNLVLLDEPFSNLDTSLREDMNTQMREWFQKANVSALMVTHDREESFVFADKIGVLKEGSLEQWDKKEVVYNKPKSSYVAGFMGEGILLQGTVLESGNVLVEKTWEVHANELSNFSQNKPGEKLDLWIRSEHIVLDHLNDESTYKAPLKQWTYRGGHWAWNLAFPGGKDYSLLTIEEPKDLVQGTEVGVTIEWEQVIVF